MKSSIRLVVTDADGTMWQFWDYFVPAMAKIVPVLAEKTGIAMDEVSRELAHVMDLRGTHEYPWVLEESKLRQNFPGTALEFREQFAAPFWAALDKYRLRYLRIFADVRETLDELHRRGIPVAILSDAPFHMAVSRAVQMGVDSVISGLYALETKEPSADCQLLDEDTHFGRDRVRQFKATPHRFVNACEMPCTFAKPNADGLELVMKDFGVKPSQVLFIGDSLVKDGGVAKAMAFASFGHAMVPTCQRNIGR